MESFYDKYKTKKNPCTCTEANFFHTFAIDQTYIMKSFIHRDFMLSTDTARQLYHESAEKMPVIDYHCHLDPALIAGNYRFENLTDIWLGGDHYKWRAMRANGVPEAYITGNRSPREKFRKWAETVPFTMRNPLYHWTHLELKRVFGIDCILNADTADEIYEAGNALLQREEFSTQAILRRFNVEVVCTTDDPADSLEAHRKIRETVSDIRVLPTWRPDKAVAVEADDYADYVRRLGEAADLPIRSYEELLEALRKRHDFFARMGCRLSDHGSDTFYAADYTEKELDVIFLKAMEGKNLPTGEIRKFRSGLLYELAVMDNEKGWCQQFHIGPIRNNFTRMFETLGPDAGYDGINDLSCAAEGYRFFDRLASAGKLARTILYNLNPKDSSVLACMAATFNDGTVPGKMQYGAAWWFLDQEDGIKNQLNILSNQGLLSRFVGMLTDSRSFLSFPRHEYFRRILCNLIGEEVEAGKLPVSEMSFLHRMVKNICYGNAKTYFGF